MVMIANLRVRLDPLHRRPHCRQFWLVAAAVSRVPILCSPGSWLVRSRGLSFDRFGLGRRLSRWPALRGVGWVINSSASSSRSFTSRRPSARVGASARSARCRQRPQVVPRPARTRGRVNRRGIRRRLGSDSAAHQAIIKTMGYGTAFSCFRPWAGRGRDARGRLPIRDAIPMARVPEGHRRGGGEPVIRRDATTALTRSSGGPSSGSYVPDVRLVAAGSWWRSHSSRRLPRVSRSATCPSASLGLTPR
jgi:hypothetical protein